VDQHFALEGVVANVDAHEQPHVRHYGDEASRVRAVQAVAKGRNDTMKRWTELIRKKVNWVLDGPFSIESPRLDDQIRWAPNRRQESRPPDQKWLKAGVMEQGRWIDTDEGTPQGAVMPPRPPFPGPTGIPEPILANLYLPRTRPLGKPVAAEERDGRRSHRPLRGRCRARSSAPIGSRVVAGTAAGAAGQVRAEGQLGRTAAQKPKAKQAGPAAGTRGGSKPAKVLRPSEAAGWCFTERACESHGWLAHSVRAYLSGTVSEKMKLKLVSTKSEDGERRYTVQR
jgi:hypothetical protein